MARRHLSAHEGVAELDITNGFHGLGIELASRSRQAHAYTESMGRPDDLARPLP
jgi:hypothetical protein